MKIPLWMAIVLAGCGTSAAPSMDAADELTGDAVPDQSANQELGDSGVPDVPDALGDVTATDIQTDLAQEVSVSCDDGNPCTDDEPGPQACSHIPNTASCIWQCGSLPGSCQKGICLPLSGSNSAGCDDDNPCTIDLCNAFTCQHFSIKKGVIVKCTNAAGHASVCDTKGNCL